MNEISTEPQNRKGEYQVGSVVFNRYRIEEYLSCGGQGRVYKALDLDLNIVVALKVLIADKCSGKEYIRFQAEARTVSKLNHPGIARVFDFGLVGSVPYLTMEFVDGQTLDRLLEIEPIENIEFIDIFTQVCQALSVAHKQGIVHRDIKPSNIVVSKSTNNTVSAKILDFGVAKWIDQPIAEGGALTPSGQIVGSPLYMSPEQSRGEHVSPISDIYSVGCVMWECLSGASPLRADTAFETVLLHQNKSPGSLKDCTRKRISEELSSTIEKMLSKEPHLRPDLDADVIPVLEREVESSNLEEPSGEPVSEVRSFRKSNFLFVVLALLTVSIALSSPFFMRPEQAPLMKTSFFEIPTKPAFDEFESSRKKSTIAFPIDHGIVRAGPADGTDARLKVLEYNPRVTALILCSSAITNQSMSTIATLPRLTDLNLRNTDISSLEGLEQMKTLTSLDLTSTKIADEDLASITQLEHLKNLVLNNTSISDDSLKYIEQVNGLSILHASGTGLLFVKPFRLPESLLEMDLSETNISIDALRAILSNTPQLRRVVLTNCPNVSPAAQRELECEFPDVGLLSHSSKVDRLSSLADRAYEKHDRKSAIRYRKECVDLLVARRGKDDKRLLNLYIALGNYHWLDGDYDGAKDWFVKADRHASAKESPVVSLLVTEHINSLDYVRTRKVTTALNKRFVQAFRMAEKIFENNALELGTRARTLAEVYSKSGNWVEAERWFKKSFGIYRRFKTSPESAEYWTLGVLHLSFADYCMRRRSFSDAAKHYELGIPMIAKVANRMKLRANLVTSYIGYTAAYTRMGNIRKAVEMNQRAIALVELDKGLSNFFLPRILRQRQSLELLGKTTRNSNRN